MSTASADESDWNTSWDGMLYGYTNSMVLRDDSLLNPGNRFARLAQRSDVAELRFNLKAESDTLRFTARAIALAQQSRNGYGEQSRGEDYVSQYQLRMRAAEGWNVAAGREVMNWGPAQFRSPSSPFYFDNGRSNPMRELSGMDVLKLSWTPDRQHSVNLARIVRSGYGAAQPDVWRDGWLAKFDSRGDDWAYGLVAVKSPQLPAFYGAHGQWTKSDELMLYGEISSSARAHALQSDANAALPFTVQTPSPRRSTVLAGAVWTFESGQSLAAEYLRDGHGYTGAQTTAYFANAAASPLSAGQALGMMPSLLGRDYLHLVWQGNPMESAGYWRAMYTRNLTDHGDSLGAYGERALTSGVSAFAIVQWNIGNARQEAAALYTRSITLGLKVALP